MSLTILNSTAKQTVLLYIVRFLLRRPSISSNDKDIW